MSKHNRGAIGFIREVELRDPRIPKEKKLFSYANWVLIQLARQQSEGGFTGDIRYEFLFSLLFPDDPPLGDVRRSLKKLQLFYHSDKNIHAAPPVKACFDNFFNEVSTLKKGLDESSDSREKSNAVLKPTNLSSMGEISPNIPFFKWIELGENSLYAVLAVHWFALSLNLRVEMVGFYFSLLNSSIICRLNPDHTIRLRRHLSEVCGFASRDEMFPMILPAGVLPKHFTASIPFIGSGCEANSPWSSRTWRNILWLNRLPAWPFSLVSQNLQQAHQSRLQSDYEQLIKRARIELGEVRESLQSRQSARCQSSTSALLLGDREQSQVKDDALVAYQSLKAVAVVNDVRPPQGRYGSSILALVKSPRRVLSWALRIMANGLGTMTAHLQGSLFSDITYDDFELPPFFPNPQ